MDNSSVQYAEVGILSIILKNPELLEKCANNIKSHMFTSIPHTTLFGVISDLQSAHVVPDFGTVMSVLQSKTLLSQCGGENYLQYLLSQNFNPANLDELCNFVLDAFKTRELITLSAKLGVMATSESNADVLITYVRNYLDNLSQYGEVDDVVNFERALKDTWKSLVDRVNSDVKVFNSTGIDKLDDVTGGFRTGDLWAIASRPGMGKSALMCNFALAGVPTLIFSREMSRDSLVERIVAIKSGIPVFNIAIGALTQKQLDVIQEVVPTLKEYPIYIDTNFSSSIEYIVSTILRYYNQYKIKVVHVDYLQLLIERDDNATHELGRITRSLKLLANSLGISIVIYSQLNRLVESREDKRPQLSDFRQSGNIEEDVDLAIFLYRDILYDPNTKHKDDIELLIRKQRKGPTGVLILKFDEVTNRVYE